jgi:hypothetical protein
VLVCVAKNRQKVGILVRKWAISHQCPSCLPPLPEVHFVKKEVIFETNTSAITLPLDHTQLHCREEIFKNVLLPHKMYLPGLVIIDFFLWVF